MKVDSKIFKININYYKKLIIFLKNNLNKNRKEKIRTIKLLHSKTKKLEKVIDMDQIILKQHSVNKSK